MPALDFDVVIVGSGPCGLSAASALGQSGARTLVLERDVYGGALQHIARIDDYADGVAGADLASALLEQAATQGASLEQAAVTGVEVFSRSRFVATSEGRGFSCGVVILACGERFRGLGIQAEERLRGRGIIDCTPCDAGFYVGKAVVVIGSGEYAQRDARFFTEVGATVTLLPSVEQILGEDRVEAVTCNAQRFNAAGIAVRIGTQPNTEWLADLLDLDSEARIPVDEHLQTELRYVLAAGDIRSGSARTVASAVADGHAAAARALSLLTV